MPNPTEKEDGGRRQLFTQSKIKSVGARESPPHSLQTALSLPTRQVLDILVCAL